MYFFEEDIVYPFAIFEINNCTYLITYNEYCNILSYVEHFRMVSLHFAYQENILHLFMSFNFRTFSYI